MNVRGRASILAGTVLAVATVLLATATCDGGDPPQPQPTSQGSGAGPSGTAGGSGGGAIQVVESGVSPTKDLAGSEMVSYGIVVTNTSNGRIAVKTQLVVRLTDAQGNPVTDRVAGGAAVTREVGVVHPGQRIGIGGNTYVGQAGAAGITVSVGSSTWIAPGQSVGGMPIAEATAGNVATKVTDNGARATLTFTVTSAYPGPLTDPSAQAVFRDGSGKIVGGTGPDRTGAEDEYKPGRSPGRIDVNPGNRPGSTEDRLTEVYISPFCC